MSYANVLALERWKQLFFTFVGALCVLALVSRVPSRVSFSTKTLKSQPAFNGLRTVIKYQEVGKTRYFDVAGFPGRSIGL